MRLPPWHFSPSNQNPPQSALSCNLQIPADPTEGGLFLRWKFFTYPVPIKLLSGLTVDLFMEY